MLNRDVCNKCSCYRKVFRRPDAKFWNCLSHKLLYTLYVEDGLPEHCSKKLEHAVAEGMKNAQ
jgi:hypothetical protein